jgi:hypothetical protein
VRDRIGNAKKRDLNLSADEVRLCRRPAAIRHVNHVGAGHHLEPLPADAMLIVPGLALAWAMNSGTVLAGTEGLICITRGRLTKLAAVQCRG